MRITFLIVGMLLLAGVVIYLASCRNKSIKDTSEAGVGQQSAHSESDESPENPYEGLRNMALAVEPEQLQISLPAQGAVVYGVVMDMGIDDGTATLVCYQTGDASMYVSSGGGIIGGGKHENVNNAAKRFVSLAQTYLPKATKTEQTPLPLIDEVKFYLLTNKGHFFVHEQVENFENNTSPWFPLFEEGNKVLTELRVISEEKE